MAEWSCSGLQLRVRRFDSDSSLHNFLRPSARVVKLVDTRDLKSLALTSVPVRVRLRAPLFCFKPLIIQGFLLSQRLQLITKTKVAPCPYPPTSPTLVH